MYVCSGGILQINFKADIFNRSIDNSWFTISKSLSQHDEKHVVPTPHSGIRVGKRDVVEYFNNKSLKPGDIKLL
jgi:hypothetical protein